MSLISPKYPIHILGTGLTALTLARSLLRDRIPFFLHTRDHAPSQLSGYRRRDHNYSLNLYPETITILKEAFPDQNWSCLHWEGGDGRVSRVNRARLENDLWMGNGSGIEGNCLYDREFRELKLGPNGSTLSFGNGAKEVEVDVEKSVVIDCMGVHSPLSQRSGGDLKILPFVVFRGTRILERKVWNEQFEGKEDIQIHVGSQGTVLRVLANDSGASEDVSLSYIYSRPAHALHSSDSLFAPNRAIQEASSQNLVSKFLNEVGQLIEKEKLPRPFDEIFDVKKMKEDKILNWLMRSRTLGTQEMLRDWEEKRLVRLGDSVCAMPILGGEGANVGIRYAVQLGKVLREEGEKGVNEWIARSGKDWTEVVERSERRLSEMHG